MGVIVNEGYLKDNLRFITVVHLSDLDSDLLQ